ncbi:MAG: hypothetical protein IPJ34_15895 [Myxococcales bacterium]|nr:hypothetical protein [Myxococcales bacterium]
MSARPLALAVAVSALSPTLSPTLSPAASAAVGIPVALAVGPAFDEAPTKEAERHLPERPALPWSAFLTVPSGNPVHGEAVSGGQPNVWVHVPAHFDWEAEKLSVVVVFHGFHNCLRSFVASTGQPCKRFQYPRTAYDLVGQFARAEARSIVVVPQLAYDAHASDPGVLGRAGAVRTLVTDALAARPFVGDRGVEAIGRVAYVSASGGFEALYPALARGGFAVDDVLVLDGFYGSSPELDAWVDGAIDALASPRPKRLAIVYATSETTLPPTEAFGEALRARLGPRGGAASLRFETKESALAVTDLTAPFSIVHSLETHDDVARVELWKLLAAAQL